MAYKKITDKMTDNCLT
jgi:SP family myo-inositol transporter-like MFS transporter 13